MKTSMDTGLAVDWLLSTIFLLYLYLDEIVHNFCIL
jgi:hypothetical protein